MPRMITTITACALTAGMTAGCGTRVDQSERLAVSQPSSVQNPGAIAAPANAPIATDAAGSAAGSVTARQAIAPTAGAAAAVLRGSAVPSETGAKSAAQGGTLPGNPSPRGTAKAEGAGGAPAGGATAVPTPDPAPGGVRSPVKVGSVSTMSGPVGATFAPFVKAVQVWVKWINDRGGVNGHPVVMKVWDDGADPARHRAQLQEAVEEDGVIAFLSEMAGVTGESSLAYIEQKKIPVIGTDTGGQWPAKSPYYFVQAAYGKGMVYVTISAAARRAASLGLTRFGTITCSEVTDCATHERHWHQYAAGLGLTSVYKGKASLVQPDFTAECLAARNAGVELLGITMDQNSVPRLAKSCSRQNYRPVYVLLGPLMTDQLTKDPNMEGTIVGSTFFPYVWKESPGVVEFFDVMKRYASGTVPGPSEAGGWLSARLFERAAAAMPEPPTSAALFEGLYSLKADTLGGMTQPLTFPPGQGSPQNQSCGWDMVMEKGAWRSSDGYRLHCGNSN